MGIGWVQLAQPRRLTAAEQALVDHVVARTDSVELRAQAASAQVTALCRCGCPSVRLHSDAPSLAPAETSRMSSTGRDDWFAVGCIRPDGEPTVVVHVVQGSLHELEVFAGEGIVVDLPAPAELTDIELI